MSGVKPGKFLGDIHVVLEHDIHASSHPYRVRAWVWRRHSGTGVPSWFDSRRATSYTFLEETAGPKRGHVTHHKTLEAALEEFGRVKGERARRKAEHNIRQRPGAQGGWKVIA